MASQASPRSYKISVPDEALQELKQRLSYAKLPSQLKTVEGDNWDFGVPVEDVKRLASYWKDGFDWRKAEAELNKLPNFITQVDVDGFGSLDIHFVHQVSPVKDAIPLLFSHGWPGSFIEVKKLLPLLKGGNGQPAFHVVAPSLPNFGFSSGVTRKGFGLNKYAETLHKLMLKLGYNQYVTQGGDWGTSITRSIGLLYGPSSHCVASHINLVLGNSPKWSQSPLLALQHSLTPYTAAEKAGLERTEWFDKEGYGYNILQQTKPQTIGFALSDSPVALLAWIYEKLHDWTDGYPWTDDEILTWISIYWFSTAGPEASVRIYHEASHPLPQNECTFSRLRQWIPHVKLAVARYPQEIQVIPQTWAATLGPLVQHSEHESGGHFAAWERPETIAKDLQRMYTKGGPCYGIVKGKSGY